MLKAILPLLLLTSLYGEEKITAHSIEMNGQPIEYSAAVGTGEVAYIAYTKEGPKEGSVRPITFAFNGGPGSASVWLHLGVLGPKRVRSHEEGQPISPPYQIVDNLETILDLTDLVFIDPMGTGLTHAESEEAAKKHYSVKGDIVEVGKFIRNYLTEHKRWNSPKYLLGESYGAIRAAGLAEYLPNEFGIFLTGIIFVSPALDFQTFIFDIDNSLPYFLYLPSYAAAAWHHKKLPPEISLQEAIQKARHFAYSVYAPWLLSPGSFNLDQICDEVAQITALPPDLVRRHQGKISDDLFSLNLLGNERKMIGRFDARETNFSDSPQFDPSDTTITGIFSGAFHDYLQNDLATPSSYNLMSMSVNLQWNYQDWNQWGYPNLMGSLRRGLLINPKVKLFFGCGYFDLATPFGTVEYCLNHLGVPDLSAQTEYYEAGHMFYLKPSERKKFKQDLIQFYERAP